MQLNILQKNRGETSETMRGVFFGTAPSQKTPLVRAARISVFCILFSVLSLYSASAAITVGVASNVGNLSSGLVAHWTFDGKNLTSSTSTSSTGLYNATNTGNPVAVIGKVGQAISFNGSTQYITSNSISEIKGVSQITISGWVKRNTNSFGPIFSQYGGPNPWITFLFHSSSGLVAVVGNAGTDYCNIAAPAYTTGWNHYAMVFDGTQTGNTNRLKIYINGVLQSISCSGTIGSTTGSPSGANIIGYDIHNNAKINAYMDDIRVYSRALTTADVQSLYKMASNTVKPLSGLIGEWKFDSNRISGTSAIDSSSNNLNGTIYGSPLIVQGKSGQALSFNGTSSYVDLGTPASVQLTSGTLSAWVNTSTCSGTCAIFYKRYAYGIYLSNGTLGAYDGGGGSLSSTNIADGLWHHVLVTFRSGVTNGSEIYLDGVRIKVFTHSIFANNVGLTIGADGARFYFTGKIDDPQIYNRVLTKPEILALYQNGRTTSSYGASTVATNPLSNGLVGYWTFDGKKLTNATATDSSGSGYNGALSGMTATSSIVIGKIGQALTFNGSNQYINVGNNPLAGATKFTYSAWIKVSLSDFSGTYKTLIDDASGDANVNNGIVVVLDDRGGGSSTAGITAQFKGSSGSPSCVLVYSSNIFSTASQWYHITLTYNGASNPTLYVNGVSKSYTGGVCSGSGAYVPRSANMYLGALNSGSAFFKGSMDDVRLYNRTLSAKEVLTLYKMGAK